MKQAILGTGLNGLVGSKLVASYQDTYDFTNLDISAPRRPVDIIDDEVYRPRPGENDLPVIVGFTGLRNQRGVVSDYSDSVCS